MTDKDRKKVRDLALEIINTLNEVGDDDTLINELDGITSELKELIESYLP